ncbi:E3 ubiquitin-protein ligase At1g63170 isoform X1 [Nymphaea colorata]|nr:E3 ubiquitin-protein ligase At1g63170 isoform X1 [Nymphaea colorata]XP_031488392.1 E3 ubiquitin-protein ligase At1g63170 isoform X1 [Nymphaea colorata]
MDLASSEVDCEDQNDEHPLLMDRPSSPLVDEHVISMTQGTTATSNSLDASTSSGTSQERTARDSMHARNPPSSALPSARNSLRRGNNYGRRRRSPLNSGLWISIELAIAMSQIIASVIVLSLSGHEKPKAPLFVWVVGYASGCLATLPLLYWRYISRNRTSEQEQAQAHAGSDAGNPYLESSSHGATSTSPVPEEEVGRQNSAISWNDQNASQNSRIRVLVDYLKMALDCFFAVWFVVGNVLIFGGHSSSSEAPNLYRLCIVFLTFSCIGYAMPFILCATICCCLPCIISILGFREDQSHARGASPEDISALPKYKFKAGHGHGGNKDENEIHSDSSVDGGVIGVGTEWERLISAEDAVCCICLAKYVDNDELRELPCTHLFHSECVDKWLKINALCPLCKHEVGENLRATSESSSGVHHGERRVGSEVAGAGFTMV